MAHGCDTDSEHGSKQRLLGARGYDRHHRTLSSKTRTIWMCRPVMARAEPAHDPRQADTSGTILIPGMSPGGQVQAPRRRT